MIYKIVMSNGPDVAIESEEALQKFLDQANTPGVKLVFTKYGIVNTSFVVSVVRHKEKMEGVSESMRMGTGMAQAQAEAMGASPFAKILADKMAMLPPQSRTAAIEESGRVRSS